MFILTYYRAPKHKVPEHVHLVQSKIHYYKINQDRVIRTLTPSRHENTNL